MIAFDENRLQSCRAHLPKIPNEAVLFWFSIFENGVGALENCGMKFTVGLTDSRANANSAGQTRDLIQVDLRQSTTIVN